MKRWVGLKEVFVFMIIILMISQVLCDGRNLISTGTQSIKSAIGSASNVKRNKAGTPKSAGLRGNTKVRAQVKSPVGSTTNNLNSYNFSFSKDIQLVGASSSGNYDFSVGGGWDVRYAYLQMIFTQSQVEELRDSTLTIYLNERSVSSFKLWRRHRYREVEKVLIPGAYFLKGNNRIRIQSYRRISDDPCNDNLNPGNWITIHGDTFLHVDYYPSGVRYSISMFPAEFMNLNSESAGVSSIMIPDDFGIGEATAAGMIASYMGSVQRFENLNVNMVKYSEVKRNSNIVFVGAKSRTPGEILRLFTPGELADADSYAVMKVAGSPYDAGRRIFAVISENQNVLLDAGRLLSNNGLIKQIKSQAFILRNVNAVDKVNTNGYRVTFKDLGYGNTYLTGASRQESSFGVSIPKNRIVQGGASIKILFRYSKNLDFAKSLLTVYVNNIPIGSKRLTSDGGNNSSMTLALPKDVIKGNYFDIKLGFDLITKDKCALPRGETPWAYILDNSYISLPYLSGNEFVFENYPNPLISEGVMNRVALVLPDDSSSLSAAGDILSFMGHDMVSNRGEIKVVRYRDFSKKYWDYNLIVIGSPKDNPLIRTLNNKLFLKYDRGGGFFESNSRVRLLEEYSRTLSSIQLIKSPYSHKKVVMVLTAPLRENLNNASKYVTDFEFKNRLSGNLAVIDQDGNASSFYFGAKKKIVRNIASQKENSNFKINQQIKTFGVFFSFVILFILIFSSVLFLRYRKNK